MYNRNKYEGGVGIDQYLILLTPLFQISDNSLRFETRAAQRRLGSKCRSNLLNVSPGGLGKMSESQFQDQLRT